ncbi:hypothetical protein O0I10_010954 [Lichtheimia ornata]|uniref:Uncharacterized protein n=1 Tax=Lichtheimia ornata TaxID=688661 RepID=A0AAD7XUJ3_9FUNG|nr:uncharacterized protein O0I10_010954 [Lichtheimia ornata]KAJ8653408.1 hypothetical protein O0I10_010954 [Lichtheimia ornata]
MHLRGGDSSTCIGGFLFGYGAAITLQPLQEQYGPGTLLEALRTLAAIFGGGLGAGIVVNGDSLRCWTLRGQLSTIMVTWSPISSISPLQKWTADGLAALPAIFQCFALALPTGKHDDHKPLMQRQRDSSIKKYPAYKKVSSKRVKVYQSGESAAFIYRMRSTSSSTTLGVQYGDLLCRCLVFVIMATPPPLLPPTSSLLLQDH